MYRFNRRIKQYMYNTREITLSKTEQITLVKLTCRFGQPRHLLSLCNTLEPELGRSTRRSCPIPECDQVSALSLLGTGTGKGCMRDMRKTRLWERKAKTTTPDGFHIELRENQRFDTKLSVCCAYRDPSPGVTTQTDRHAQ